MRWLGLLLLAVFVGGCATAFPESVMRTVDTRITADELLRDPAAHKGARVILGGDVLAVQPRPGLTEIELLARRLRGDDSPERSDRSPGRALLHTPEFLDPAVYAPGRRITVVGQVAGVEERRSARSPIATRSSRSSGSGSGRRTCWRAPRTTRIPGGTGRTAPTTTPSTSARAGTIPAGGGEPP